MDKKVVVGVVVTVLVIPICVAYRDHVQRVWANPEVTDQLKKEQDQLRADQQEMRALQESQAQQTTAVYGWIEKEEQKRDLEQRHEEEMKAAAPPGMVWDLVSRKYVKERGR